jgi:hypothetical protein
MANHYEGHQWRVTDDGIEQRDGNYNIRAEDLDMDVGDGRLGWAYGVEKNWVDVEDFKRAFEVARRVHC